METKTEIKSILRYYKTGYADIDDCVKAIKKIFENSYWFHYKSYLIGFLVGSMFVLIYQSCF